MENEHKIYDFKWIDDMVENDYKKRNKNPQFTVSEYVKGIIYPHNIFLWSMPDGSFMMDPGYNDFLMDTDNYVEQLKEYVKKFGIIDENSLWKCLKPKYK